MRHFLRAFCAKEQGATAIEYGLIAALVILVTIGAMYQLGSGTTDMWNNIAAHI